MKHLHFDIIGYTHKEGVNMMDSVLITVIDCTTEVEALARAKEMLDRPFYYLQKVWECKTCAAQEEQAATQRYLMAKLGKHLDG